MVEDDAAARTILWAIYCGKPPRSSSRAIFQTVRRRTILVPKRSVAVAGCAVDTNGDDKLVQSVCARKGLLSDAKRTTNAYVVFEDLEGATTPSKRTAPSGKYRHR